MVAPPKSFSCSYVVLVLETFVFSGHFRITDDFDLREHASVCHIGDASARLIENEDEDDDENDYLGATTRPLAPRFWLQAPL